MAGDTPVAIVTAASRGMGAACARELASRGWRVSLMARGADVEALADELGGIATRGDTSRDEDLGRAVKATLDALINTGENKPWITLFNRESKSGKTARFQMMLVDQQASGPFMVHLMAFGFEAKMEVTQVLFFKFRKGDAKIKQHSGKVTIDADVLASVRPVLKTKLAAHAGDFIARLPDL